MKFNIQYSIFDIQYSCDGSNFVQPIDFVAVKKKKKIITYKQFKTLTFCQTFSDYSPSTFSDKLDIWKSNWLLIDGLAYFPFVTVYLT